jgi:hypothetical protein
MTISRFCIILFPVLFVFVSCGAKHSSRKAFGKMTVAELVREKGRPIKEENIPVTNGKVLQYPNDERFQVKGDIVTNSFRQPKTEEVTLLYWKNNFKDCETVDKTLKSEGHGPAEKELACPAMGVSVLYTDGSGVVSRVVEYAPQ